MCATAGEVSNDRLAIRNAATVRDKLHKSPASEFDTFEGAPIARSVLGRTDGMSQGSYFDVAFTGSLRGRCAMIHGLARARVEVAATP